MLTMILIFREGWSEMQLNLFNKVVQILDTDRLARLSLKDVENEPAKRRAHVGKYYSE